VDFSNTLIKAREEGLIDGTFQIERTSPCEVASQAGFMQSVTAVYEPNAKKTSDLCHGEKPDKNAQSPDSFTKIKEENGVKIAGLGTMTLEDFEGGKHGNQLPPGDRTLLEKVKELVSNLGYDQEEDSEFL
jgi:hypothetical protein